jgi:hypothetical protein
MFFTTSLNYTIEVNQVAANLCIQGIAVGVLVVEGFGYTTLNIWILLTLIKKKRKEGEKMRKFFTKFIPTGVAMDLAMLLRWQKKIGTKSDADKDKLKEVLDKRVKMEQDAEDKGDGENMPEGEDKKEK